VSNVIIPFANILDPNVEVYDSRIDYEKKTGRAAPQPNYAWQVQEWVDKRAANLAGLWVEYPWVIATTSSGGIAFFPTSEEPNEARKAFYKEYGILEVPKIVKGGNFPAAIAKQPNFPWEEAGKYNDPVWVSQPQSLPPVRPLKDNEAFYPSPFAPLALVDMVEYRKTVPPKFPPTQVTSDIGNASPEIQNQLSQILATLRLQTQMINQLINKQ
jgi:hypothetical protein